MNVTKVSVNAILLSVKNTNTAKKKKTAGGQYFR